MLVVRIVRVGLFAGLFALAAAPASGSEGNLPVKEPLATLASSVSRLDPLTLRPTGPRVRLPEYHGTYSFSPDGSAIAFGVSTNPASGTGGRVGVRILETADLAASRDISTGVYADTVAWLEPGRIVALLGECFSSAPVPVYPCSSFDQVPRHSAVAAIDPVTQQVIERSRVPIHCRAAEARGEALISLAGRRLSTIGPALDVRTVRLPRPFAECGEMTVAPGALHAFVVSPSGDLVARVELASGRLTVHRFPAGPNGEFVVEAIDDTRLAMAHRGPNGQPRGVEILGTATERRKVIDPQAGGVRVSERTVFTFDGRPLSNAGKIGVHGFDRAGRRRFELLHGERIADVVDADRFMYAVNGGVVAVIDAGSGAVVSRSRSGFTGVLLTVPQSSGDRIVAA